MSTHSNPLVGAMLRGEFYPGRPRSVELRETHISYVFLAGDLVYKLKKPLQFAFLDCRDLEHRRQLCNDELRLNSRLAPDVYLAVLPIVSDRSGFRFGGLGETAVDYVVKMRRLPADRMLDHLVARGRADRELILTIARKIAAFHSHQTAEHASQYGSAAALWRLIIDEADQMRHLIGPTLTLQRMNEIDEYLRGFVGSHWRLFCERARTGRVREGHGDLRCDQICVEDKRISIFDCIEFSERFRYCDIASEIGFLAMDFDRLGAPALADELVRFFAKDESDGDFATLAPFYKCYRATVRGVVETMRSHQADDADRERAAASARNHFELAARYARRAKPALLVMCGLSGTGKSTLARALRYRFGYPVISSDQVRKRIAGITAESHLRQGYSEGIYSDAATDQTYQAILEEAAEELKMDSGAIVDATFKDSRHRMMAKDLASRLGAPVLFVECRASDTEIRRRLGKRALDPTEASDATIFTYERQVSEFMPLREVPDAGHLVVEAADDLGVVLGRIETALDADRFGSGDGRSVSV